jgi:glycosyltransferase involved in cell wall biosynthesis
MIRSALKDGGPLSADLVLTFGETNYPAARALADQFSAPLVFALRSNFVDEFLQFGTFSRRVRGFPRLQKRFQRWWKQRLERMLCHGSDLIVFQTDYDRDNVTTRNPAIAEKSTVIPNSFRVSWLPAELGRPVTCQLENDDLNDTNTLHGRQPFQLVYLGHLNERKGVQYLFPALRILSERGVFRFHLDVVGFGGLETWARGYVTDNGLDTSVTFHGRIDQPLSYVAAADLMVIPSLYDSFPNTVLEALFVGTPVIGADSAGISTMLHHQQLMFPRGDSQALADRLQWLIEDRSEFQEVCRLSADRRATFDFDWAEQWESVFVELREHGNE